MSLHLPLEKRILMCPSSDSDLSATRKILSSIGDVNGTDVCCVIAFSRASPITVFVDLADTLTLYASQSATNCDLLYTRLSGAVPWCWLIKATRRPWETLLLSLRSRRISYKKKKRYKNPKKLKKTILQSLTLKKERKGNEMKW